MTKRLTERRALLITRGLFLWLTDHPRVKSKGSWPGWDKYGSMESNCALCQLHLTWENNGTNKQRRRTGCSNCSIKWHSGEFNRCTHPDSPYYKWHYSKTSLERRKYAWEIVNLAKQAENRLKEESKCPGT